MKKTVSVRAALLILLLSLVFQYCYLEGFPLTNPSYLSILASSPGNSHLHQYRVNDYRVSVEVPEGTNIQVSPDKGEEMQVSIYFANSDLGFRGYLQVWKLKDLEAFLKNSRSLSPFDFISYQMSELKQNYHQGFQTEWSADFGDKVISGREYWWKPENPEEAIRVSFFTDTSEFPKALESVIENMLKTLEVSPG